MSDVQVKVEAEHLGAHQKLPMLGPLRRAIISRRIAETHERIFKRLGYWLPKALEMDPLRASRLTPRQPDDPPPQHSVAQSDPYQ